MLNNTKKQTIRFAALGVMAVGLSACVGADCQPHGHYGNAADDRYYYGDDGYYHRAYEPKDRGDYDNKWDYGRRGNGNFHGTDAYDRHDD